MCANVYKYIQEWIYMHYHVGYVFIQYGNFKMAYFMKHIDTQNFILLVWIIFVGTYKFLPSLHMLAVLFTILLVKTSFKDCGRLLLYQKLQATTS